MRFEIYGLDLDRIHRAFARVVMVFASVWVADFRQWGLKSATRRSGARFASKPRWSVEIFDGAGAPRSVGFAVELLLDGIPLRSGNIGPCGVVAH